jgi:hypothetical protein
MALLLGARANRGSMSEWIKTPRTPMSRISPKVIFLGSSCEHYFDFAFSPISTSRRMASGRLILVPCFSTQSSIAAN